MPATTISEYRASVFPPSLARLMERPRPSEPTTSSAVTARVSATDDERRTPVAT
jgi:hypothetical protein